MGWESTPSHDFKSLTHADPHDDFYSSTTTEEFLPSSSGFAQSHESVQTSFQRKAKKVPSGLMLSLEPSSTSSNSFDSPLISPGLKRRSHIRRKERPRRLPSDVANGPSRWSAPVTTSPPSVQYAYSPRDSAPSYTSPPSVPIRTYLRQESPERTDLALIESHPCSPPRHAPSYNPRLLPPIRTQLRKESWDMIPDSPSIYSIMTPESGIFDWDTTGDLRPDASTSTLDTEAVHWDLRTAEYLWEGRSGINFEPDCLWPEIGRPGPTRRNTAIIVELLRQRRRKAGLE